MLNIYDDGVFYDVRAFVYDILSSEVTKDVTDL